MGGQAEQFEYQEISQTEIRITHYGRPATVLRGNAARTFLADIERADPQELMARLTGNYKRGNERTARNHPRNQQR